MEKSVEKSVQELIAKAKREGKVIKGFSTRSSLHSLIKTPEQARRFMLLLKDAESRQ